MSRLMTGSVRVFLYILTLVVVACGATLTAVAARPILGEAIMPYLLLGMPWGILATRVTNWVDDRYSW